LPNDVEDKLKSNERAQALVSAIVSCQSDEDLLWRVLRDLLSYDEIEDIANRYAAAQLLLSGRSQQQVHKELGIAIATVNRVAQWVKGPQTTGGCAALYKRQHGESPPNDS
jgi:uncharacterized protein YerC